MKSETEIRQWLKDITVERDLSTNQYEIYDKNGFIKGLKIALDEEIE